MLKIHEHREERAKTLQARIKRCGKIQSDIQKSPEWERSGIPEKWSRAQQTKTKLQTRLGMLASYWLMEDL